MKKILSAILVLGLLVVSGCAGRGSFFEWGDSPRATAMPVYAAPTSVCQ